jgi:hypothetical protein
MSGSSLSDDHPPRDAAFAEASKGDTPLQLSVHGMPDPEAPPINERQTRLGRWKMLAVLLVCATPVLASYFTYYVIRPEGRRNFGELIDPQRSLPSLVASTPDGQPFPLPTLKGQWLLVAVGSGACDALCEQQLYMQRQLREMLGKERDRVERVWLLSDDQSVREAIRPGLQGTTILRVPPQELAQWLAPAAGAALPDHLYVVDPMGNWMMRFPARMERAQAAQAKRDLDRLLRASSSWDKAGR